MTVMNYVSGISLSQKRDSPMGSSLLIRACIQAELQNTAHVGTTYVFSVMMVGTCLFVVDVHIPHITIADLVQPHVYIQLEL
jgi:hypothetical protein